MAPFLIKRGSSFEERFITEPNSGCWLWLGGVQSRGYGMLGGRTNKILATRFSYERYRGPIPHGLQVLHKCDTPLCVNPDHLFLGTRIDNMQDAVRKNRDASGMRHGLVKLTTEQIEEIRSLAPTMSQKQLADLFLVNQSTISRIVSHQRRRRG